MHGTKNDIPLNNRKEVIDVLQALLADAIDLKSQAKQAHWNVKGETFISLHELFDKVSGEVDEAVDLIAERIVQLGGEAVGTVRAVADISRLKEYPFTIADGQKHADALSTALAMFNRHARLGIDETDEQDDAVTADMLTGIARGLDKLLWFVESHLPDVQQQKAGRKAV